MKTLRNTVMSGLVLAVMALGLVGCACLRKQAGGEHPKAEHPKAEHPTAEHPK